jgi:hypothetical protein
MYIFEDLRISYLFRNYFSINPMVLQPESGLCLLTYWRFGFRVAGGKPAAFAQLLLNPDSSARSQSHVGVKQGRDMGEKHGCPILLTKHLFHACKVLLHAVNQLHGTDGFTSPLKEGVLQILSPLKSIVLGRV